MERSLQATPSVPETGAIGEIERLDFPAQSVGRLVSSRRFVRPDALVDEVADALRAEESLLALAVVDDSGQAVGIVDRKEFFSTMVRAYAREVFRSRTIVDIMTRPTRLAGSRSLFVVAEQLSDDLASGEVRFYLVLGRDGQFAGVISTQDLLLHLSRMTQEDIELARQLQTRIVKERGLAVGRRFEFVASSQSARGVGGDFYDIRRYGHDRWVFTLCDVAGKGVAASFITSILWGMMNAYDFRRGLSGFIRRVNSHIASTFDAEKFVTGIFAEYDETTNRVRICDLGHSHIYLSRGGTLRRIVSPRSNLPIGVSLSLVPRFATFEPAEQDILFIATDGLLEQQNERGEVFRFESAATELQSSRDEPVEQIADRILRRFHDFRGDHHLGDDVTFAIMRFVAQEVTL